MITPSFGLTATERVLPKLALDFTTASLDSRVTFTRTTGASNPATYVNSGGVVTLATNNQPRFDYNPVSLVCKGLLIEESRINLFRGSDLSDPTYVAVTNLTRSTSATLSPDGVNYAQSFVPTASNAQHYMAQGSISVTTGTAYSFSVFAKPAGINTIAITLSAPFGFASARWNLSTQSLVASSGMTSTSIEPYANGWFRVTATASATSTAAATMYIDSQNIGTFLGNGVDGFLAWGAQLEAGAFATSYIPTTSAALTRNADSATMTGTNFSDWFNASEGAFSIDCIINTKPSAQILMEMSDGTSNNRLQFQRDSSSTNLSYISIVGGAIPVNLSRTGAFVSDVGSICAAYKLDSYAVAVQGGSVATDTSGGVPPLDRLRIGATVAGTAPSSGWYQKISYYPQRLINAEVQSFSK